MNATPVVERDERTVAIENAGHRWAYNFVAFALLIDVVYRGMVRNEAAWDLLALVIVGGFIPAAYQARHKALPSRWAKEGLLVACLAGVIGAVAAVIAVWSRG